MIEQQPDPAPGGFMKLDPRDDLRHRPAAGNRMRDSLFWEVVVPEEQIGMQVYLYLTDRGRAGDTADLDDFSFERLRLRQYEPLHASSLEYRGDDVAIDFDFRGLHEAFTYHRNPDGLPRWFAENRMEQTGRVRGAIQARRCRTDFPRETIY